MNKSIDISTYSEADLIELYEDRVAVRIFDGGMEVKAAERAAYFDWRRWVGKDVVAPIWIREKAKG